MPVVFATDLIILLLLGMAAYLAWNARRGGAYADGWAELKRNRLAVVSMLVLGLFLAVAAADSVRWKDAVRGEDGTVTSASTGSTVYNAQALSLLDRAFTSIRTQQEKTYSAPMSGTLFSRETVEAPDGTITRDYPPLEHPGIHILGTDKVGKDVFFTAMKGVRTGIVIGAGTTIVIVPFAILFGVLAGFFGGIVDDVIQYVYTTLASIPGVLLIVAFMLLFGNTGYQGGLVTEGNTTLGFFVPNERLFWLCVILGITSWTDLCRLIRGETLKLREMEYVQAARAFGVPRLKIIARHIVPNVMHLVLITFVLQFSGLVLAEAVLSYIGIGVGPETGSWGNMINTARLELSREPVVWWNLFGAFVFMFALVLPANIFGDAIRDVLDPKLRYRE